MDTGSKEDTRGRPAGTNARFGGAVGSTWKFLDAGGFVVAQGAPTTENDGLRLDVATRVRWCVMMPAGVTDYSVTLYRWVGVWRTSDGAAQAGPEWVPDRVIEGLTGSTTLVQEIDNDRVCCRVTDVTGTPTGDGLFRIVYKAASGQSFDTTTTAG